MKTMQDLTPEVRGKISEYKSAVREFYNGIEFDRKSSTDYIEKIYQIAGYDKPVVIYADNPNQYKAFYHKLKLCGSDLEKIYKIKNESPVEDTDIDLYNKLMLTLYKAEKSWKPDTNNADEDVKTHYLFLCSAYTRGYLTWYRFINKELSISCKREELLEELYQLSLKTSIGRCYFTKGVVLVLKLPKVKFTDSKLHCADGPAIEFEGGYNMYYWKGVQVPEKLIMTPDEITREDLRLIDNVELRRAYIEKLGVAQYFEKMADEKSVLKVVDEDIDEQGNPMKLVSFDFEGETIQALEVICPSTHRVYNIYPPSQKCKNVWEAKADTFSGKKLSYRHGDVGLVKRGDAPEKPLLET